MKKNLLFAAAFAVAFSAGAQTTYNYFDASDVDKDGWLWFDSSAKIKKYCGTLKKGFKIQLEDAGWENDDFEYPATVGDPKAVGFNEAGVQGGAGAKTGAIILPESNLDEFSIGLGSFNGGGILMHLPDCAQVDMFLSVGSPLMYASIQWADGHQRASDCQGYSYKTHPNLSSLYDPLSETSQFEWVDIQNHVRSQNLSDGTEIKIPLKSEVPGEQKTLYIANNNQKPLYIHGIRVYTYTNAASAGIADVAADTLGLVIDGKRVETAMEADIEVYSIAGVKVASAQGTFLDCGMLASGVYVVKATANGESATVKAIL